ncbi:MAG: 5-formyltetrahydrofolate cyclo-ligase [Salinivirgaceae bacterium]|jgi:5-formyltetrahydrofolate cyclo-ligase|nr:5-formyltetrahydrofolate cyclo-ligase [Salinivirgaceae bacterium]
MNNIQQQKKELRKIVRDFKALQTIEDKMAQSEAIFKKVEQLTEFTNAKVVMLYWSMYDEVSTHAFIDKWGQTKTILLPMVDGNRLRIKQYVGSQSMQKGELFDIPEPTGTDYTNTSAIDLIIVPGVAFDKNNNRIGRGRGYYDKLLENSKAIKLGVCFDYQFFDDIPIEKHDLPMNKIIIK